jgi:Protein of unknown function (DUF2971)
MSKKLHEEHKEVMHYTSAFGLQGIVTSKTLWASHASFLNDAEEVEGFFRRVFPVIIRPVLEKHVAESQDLASCVQTAGQLGMNLFDHLLGKIVKGFRDAELRAQDHYIASFCAAKDEWISQNGLLSQWRGYGVNGGYAIVFDSAKLDSMLATEGDTYYEERLLWSDVRYDMTEPSEVEDEQVLEHIRKVKKGAYIFLTTGEVNMDVEEALESNSVLSVLWKHKGFAEEKEVRIVVSEPSAEVGPDPSNQSGKSYRGMYSYLCDGVLVPCIHLFEDQKLNALPIRRVIVGPHPEKQERKKSVEILLRNHGIDAEVSVTDTPFRGK